MSAGVRGEVVCVTAASSVVQETFCWIVPVLMGISVLHHIICSLLKAAFASALLSNYII